MTKKILIIVAVLACAAVFGLSILYRKAPELLTSALTKSLHKKVVIESIEYNFPGFFELSGFKILENKPFEGEEAFSAENIKFQVSLTDLFEKKLVIDKIEVENAAVTVRKFHKKMVHALSDVPAVSEAAEISSANGTQTSALIESSLLIEKLILKKSHFKYIDFDVAESGFVLTFDGIDATIKNISLPANLEKTFYDVKAKLLQGREQKIASMSVKGWTDVSTADTEATFKAEDLYLPYYRPYTSKVTPADIVEGYLGTESRFSIRQKNLNLDMNIEIIGLAFDSYEEGDQLFGFNANEIVSFLKDRSGKFKFQIVASWNIADKSIRVKDVIRKSIEKSLKSSLVSNVGVLVGNIIEKIGEKSLGQGKSSVDGTVQKIKDFLKY